jgi:uncharacterized lipoprotein YmbA
MDSSKAFRLLLLILCLTLPACLSLEPKPDPSRFFALASLPHTAQRAENSVATNALALGIGPVRFPGYLDRQQIVTRISQNRFAVAENDRWAEPLEENFSRVLAQNLSILISTASIVGYPWERNQRPTYQVQVEVLRFEPNAEQLIELWVRWSILDNARKTISVKDSYLSQRAADRSAEASVAAMSDVLANFSKEIAAAIRVL